MARGFGDDVLNLIVPFQIVLYFDLEVVRGVYFRNMLSVCVVGGRR